MAEAMVRLRLGALWLLMYGCLPSLLAATLSLLLALAGFPLPAADPPQEGLGWFLAVTVTWVLSAPIPFYGLLGAALLLWGFEPVTEVPRWPAWRHFLAWYFGALAVLGLLWATQEAMPLGNAYFVVAALCILAMGHGLVGAFRRVPRFRVSLATGIAVQLLVPLAGILTPLALAGPIWGARLGYDGAMVVVLALLLLPVPGVVAACSLRWLLLPRR